jgi:hypothetical protein
LGIEHKDSLSLRTDCRMAHSFSNFRKQAA